MSEFRYVGEVKTRPDPATTNPVRWRRYLYFRQNRLGWVRENWYHGSGCRRYFSVERHTASNQVRPVGSAS